MDTLFVYLVMVVTMTKFHRSWVHLFCQAVLFFHLEMQCRVYCVI